MSSDENDHEEVRTVKEENKVPIVLRTMVSGPEAGSIIGRKGETIKNMREESRAKIKIEGDGPTERIITVDGPTDSIFKAYTMICKVLESRDKKDDKAKERKARSDSVDSDELMLTVLVPASQCGALIGKEGSKIKEMRGNTGADIHISADPLPGSTEREMRLRGKREQITKCIYHVCDILMENKPKGEVRLYIPDRIDRERERDRSFRGERYAEREVDPRADYYRTGRLGRRGDESPPVRYGSSVHHPFDAIMDFARRHDGGMRLSSGGSMRSGGHLAGSTASVHETKHEMNVSNEQVGAVIGRKGSKINEIRSISGANINIMEIGASKRDRRDFSSDPDRERVIEIIGTPEQVAVAKSFISVAVELAEGAERRDYRRNDRDRSRSRERGARYDDRRRW